MTVLVTGGAGYIGAHVVRLLLERGETPVVVDDLSSGRADRNLGIAVERIDLNSATAADRLAAVMKKRQVASVIHFAALKAVNESVQEPARYYRHNTTSLANVLIAVERARVERFVFSSSAAVYGNSERALTETDPTAPVNPYGETKLAGEWLTAASAKAANLRTASLRYFNVAGAGWPELGDMSVNNLVPMTFARLEQEQSPEIFGNDFETADGTCVRDYIHVLDVATAHLAVLEALGGVEPSHRVYNVGTGQGTSVREIINIALEVTGSLVKPKVVGRREGDPAIVVAAVERIREQTGWSARHGITETIESAWRAHQNLRDRGR